MNNIVIYTAISGNYDQLREPEFIPEGCDFVCFTDGRYNSKTWKIVNVEMSDRDPCRGAKIYKVLPHKFLPEYEYSIWIDGNIVLKGDAPSLIRKYLKKACIAFYGHHRRDCIFEEAEVCIEENKDDPDMITKQMDFYRKEGYPENNGLVTCSVILRRNSPEVNKNDEDWWEQIGKYSRRDQLSFNYVAYQNRFPYSIIKGHVYKNPYFKRVPHLNEPRKIKSKSFLTTLFSWR